jgi:hypothetical protein
MCLHVLQHVNALSKLGLVFACTPNLEVNIAFKDINHMKHPKSKSLVVLVVFFLGQFKNYVPKFAFLTTFKAQVFPSDNGTYNPSNMNKCFPFVFSWKKNNMPIRTSCKRT